VKKVQADVIARQYNNQAEHKEVMILGLPLLAMLLLKQKANELTEDQLHEQISTDLKLVHLKTKRTLLEIVVEERLQCVLPKLGLKDLALLGLALWATMLRRYDHLQDENEQLKLRLKIMKHYNFLVRLGFPDRQHRVFTLLLTMQVALFGGRDRQVRRRVLTSTSESASD